MSSQKMVFEDVGMKDGMMMQQSNYHTSAGGVIQNNYQAMPVVRKRGRPKGSVNKRGGGNKRGTRRAGRRGAAFAAESGRGMHQPLQQQQQQQQQQPPPSGCSPRLNVVRGLHGRILTTGARKGSMTATSLCDMDFNPASYEQSMQPGQSGLSLRDLRRQSEEYHHSNMQLESNVFNFEEHSELSPPYVKMDHHHHDGMLSSRGRSPAYRDMKYMHDPNAKCSSDFVHMERLSMPPEQGCDKSKNFLSIEDDLGFLAELPPIDTDGTAGGDGHGNKTNSKEPGGGFLQSFLSFIEGNNEPSATPVALTVEPQAVSRGRGRGIGTGRVRRGRGGSRGRPPMRKRGAYSNGQDSGCERHQVEHFNSTQHQPKPKRRIEEGNEKDGNPSEFLECSTLQKDVVLPNPEAPSFSSDEEDATNDHGIADSVAFVIRRLSEDEPPGENSSSKKNHQETKKTSYAPTKMVPTVTIYKRRGRRPKVKEETINNNNSDAQGADVMDNSYDSYEFSEASTRRTSMRRCKEEVIKKRQELIIKSQLHFLFN